MIIDTNGVDCNIIRESEFGFYDTARVSVCFAVKENNRIYIKLKDNREFWLTMPKERLEQNE
jgi:hypothetical protein